MQAEKNMKNEISREHIYQMAEGQKGRERASRGSMYKGKHGSSREQSGRQLQRAGQSKINQIRSSPLAPRLVHGQVGHPSRGAGGWVI